MRNLGFITALCLLLAVGCTPIAEPEPGARQQGSAIVGGEESPGDTAVVALVARRTRCMGEPLTLLCSGALVAPDVVLTAAHCLQVFGPEGAYEVFLGTRLLPEPEPGGRFVRVARAVVHPGYVRGSHAWDVALLRLAAPVAVEPLRLPEAGWGRLEAGQRVRAVGFGETRQASEPMGWRRSGGLVVEQVEETAFRAGPGPAMSCVGDSGGPVLALGDSGREVLVGVTVSGDPACRAEARHVRVEALVEAFLRPFLAEPPGAPGRVLRPEALCREACASSAECPSGLSCEPQEGGASRCLLHSLQVGDYGAECTEDEQCGAWGVCARLEPEGEGACRCFTPCDAPRSGGCASAPGAGLWGMLAVLRWLSRRGEACASWGRRASGRMEPGTVERRRQGRAQIPRRLTLRREAVFRPGRTSVVAGPGSGGKKPSRAGPGVARSRSFCRLRAAA